MEPIKTRRTVSVSVTYFLKQLRRVFYSLAWLCLFAGIGLWLVSKTPFATKFGTITFLQSKDTVVTVTSVQYIHDRDVLREGHRWTEAEKRAADKTNEFDEGWVWYDVSVPDRNGGYERKSVGTKWSVTSISY